jgi:arsenite methyltransferase
MPPRFIAKQLSNPTGFFGYVMGSLMNWHNAKLNAFAVQRLELNASDRVLEIGFGGGVALRRLIPIASFVAGVDRSEDAVKVAQSRFATPSSAGRVDFRVGSVDKLPFDSHSFDKVITVNTVYFWTSLESGCQEIRRVLSPGGRAVIGFVPKLRMDRMNMPKDIFTTRSPEELVSALSKAGFLDIRIAPPQDHAPWKVAVAV